MPTDHSGCKYLIYQCWETSTKNGIIAGSLLFDFCPQTELEAQTIVADLVLKDQKSKSFYDVFVGTMKTRYTYIKNEATWWPESKVTLS